MPHTPCTVCVIDFPYCTLYSVDLRRWGKGGGGGVRRKGGMLRGVREVLYCSYRLMIVLIWHVSGFMAFRPVFLRVWFSQIGFNHSHTQWFQGTVSQDFQTSFQFHMTLWIFHSSFELSLVSLVKILRNFTWLSAVQDIVEKARILYSFLFETSNPFMISLKGMVSQNF